MFATLRCLLLYYCADAPHISSFRSSLATIHQEKDKKYEVRGGATAAAVALTELRTDRELNTVLVPYRTVPRLMMLIGHHPARRNLVLVRYELRTKLNIYADVDSGDKTADMMMDPLGRALWRRPNCKVVHHVVLQNLHSHPIWDDSAGAKGSNLRI